MGEYKIQDELYRGLEETVEMYKKSFDAFQNGDTFGEKVKDAAYVMHEETTLETKVAVPVATVGAIALGPVMPFVAIGYYGGTKLLKYFQKKK